MSSDRRGRSSNIDRTGLATLLQKCGDLSELHQLRASIFHNGYGTCVYLLNHLIQTYGRFGRPQTSRQIFDSMPLRNVYSWSLMIAAYVRNGHCSDAFAVFERMQTEGAHPNPVTLLHVLEACSSLAEAMKVRRFISASRYKDDMVLQTSLIRTYARCHSFVDAREVFDGMPEKDLVAWNAMAGACVLANDHTQQSSSVIRLLREIDLAGVKPDARTFGCLACGSSSLSDCKFIQQRIIASGYQFSAPLQNSLINALSKCGGLKEARSIFDQLDEKMKDVVSWSSMISACNRSGNHHEALELYEMMELDKSVEPNPVTFISVVSACGSLGEISRGKGVHAKIVAAALENEVGVGSALMNFYSKWGSLEDARRVFDRIERKDVLCWNFMLAAYSDHGFPEEVLRVYQEMNLEPNAVTYTNVLIACSLLGDMKEGQKLHQRIIASAVETDVTLDTALLSMYIKCGSLEIASEIFKAMQTKDVIAWNFMLAGYIDNGRDSEALELFRSMQDVDDDAAVVPNNVTLANVFRACSKLREVKSGSEIHHSLILENGFETDAVTEAALINMYAACGELEKSKMIFDDVSERRKDVVVWSCMIACYAQAGFAQESLRLYERMLAEDVAPNSVTFVSVLGACSSLGDIRRGKEILLRIEESGLDGEEMVQNSLLSMYAKCGSLEEASNFFFQRMQKRDVISWTAMVAANSHHGRSEAALELVKEMELDGVCPDAVTFLNVLQACSHAGDLQQGWRSLIVMRADYGIDAGEDHLCCLVDMLARAGRLAEAEEVICKFAAGDHDTSMGWMILLGACRVQNDLGAGLRAAQWLHPYDHAAVAVCSLLSNLYADLDQLKRNDQDDVDDKRIPN